MSYKKIKDVLIALTVFLAKLPINFNKYPIISRIMHENIAAIIILRTSFIIKSNNMIINLKFKLLTFKLENIYFR